MGFFKKVEGDAAVLNSGGVYRQCDLYTRDGLLYAKVGGGFVKLYADGSTTKAKMQLNAISADTYNLHKSRTGVLCADGVAETVPIGFADLKFLTAA